MLKEKAWNYLFWLTILAGTLVIPLVFLVSDGPHVAKGWRESIGHLAMAISFFLLLVTATFGASVADSDENTKPSRKWALWVVAYAFIGMLAQLFSGEIIYRNNPAVIWSAYIPGIIFCVNLTAVILIQIWMAVEGLKLSLWTTLPVSGLFATWTCYALINCGDMKFVAISAVVDGLVVLSIPSILLVNKLLRPKVVVKKTLSGTTRSRRNHIHVM